ncbi:MAG: hypothetical protein OEU68_00945 [Nitrospira sp.]|nr:hypothetical protein [Nitrospira sp.]MDH4244981.1 hypothetical protein [Nitrospira sp.]MDH4354459.1 hypothetical protein [Nitrospira sp.]MDH5319228.1 hypothetical protein [Nitrospira sp.]
MRIFGSFAVVVVALGVVSFSATSHAQVASGVPGDQIDDIPVTIGGVKELFTAVRDAGDANQWYYIPDKPRVSESQGADGKAEPDFTLVRYQMRDPQDPTKEVAGGVLVFSARLAVPADAHTQIVDAIAKKTNNKTFRLGPMPIKSSRVHMYAPDGKFVTSAAQGEGVGPAYSAQKMTFSVNLTQVGTQVLDAMSDSAGIPLYVDMTYRRLTPKMGFKIKVNWESLQKHYSNDKQFRAQASYYGLFGGSADVKASTIRDTLEKGGHIKVESVTGEQFKPEDVERVMQSFISRINQTILEMNKPPEKIEAAKSGLADAKGTFVSAQFGYAVKKQLNVSRLNETIDYTTRAIEEAQTVASGLIGIGSYAKEIKERHIVNIKPGQFSTAYFALPAVGDDLGINQISLEVNCRLDDQKKLPATAIWTKERGAWHWKGVPAQFIWFPLQSITGDDPEKIKKLKFESVYTIVTGGQSFVRRHTHEGFNGDIALIPAVAVANAITMDTSRLPWAVFDQQQGKIEEVDIVLKAGDRTFSQKIAPIRVDGKWVDAPIKKLLVERGATVIPTVQFRLTSGEKRPWKDNGNPISAGEEGNYDLRFFPSDVP